MMVEPTDSYQVVGVVAAAVGTLSDVVGLEPVAASTSFDRALPLIPIQDEAADTGWDRFSQVGVGDWVETVGDDDPDLPVAEDLRESVRTDPGTTCYFCSRLSVGFGGEGSVDEYFRHGYCPSWFPLP